MERSAAYANFVLVDSIRLAKSIMGMQYIIIFGITFTKFFKQD